ncbi:MAG: hypothetical protein ABW321_16565, partial [Polyangiales bacterium]
QASNAKVSILDGRCCFYALDNIVICVWLKPATSVEMTEMARFSDEVTQRWERYSSVHVIEDNSGVPTKDGRDTLIARARANKSRLACVAALLPEGNIMATLMRAFVRGVRTLTRGEIDIGIEQQPDALATWLAPRHSQRTGVTVSGQAIEDLLVAARARAVGR